MIIKLLAYCNLQILIEYSQKKHPGFPECLRLIYTGLKYFYIYRIDAFFSVFDFVFYFVVFADLINKA